MEKVIQRTLEYDVNTPYGELMERFQMKLLCTQCQKGFLIQAYGIQHWSHVFTWFTAKHGLCERYVIHM